MPVQSLRAKPHGNRSGRSEETAPVLARLLLLALTVALAGYGMIEVIGVVQVAGITVLDAVFIVHFVTTFGWISHACATAIVGLLAGTPASGSWSGEKSLTSKTALVMPVYNENPVDTAAALQAMALDLQRLGQADAFEIMVVSDSTSADVWVRETIAYSTLRHRLAEVMPVWYRRRWKNTARKAGNIADFVTRWGGHYRQFIVLDADSVISGELIVLMAREMEADDRLGILQSVPALAGGETFFARLQQFAGRVYGPVVARGLAAWSGNDGNYWGHNAIIRMQAFAEAAGLPELKGRRPIGGHIMSHDFVEAALIRRAGWKVRMLPDHEGSYEDSPPSLIDVSERDRRWAQGNLQHLGVIGGTGLSWPSRLHFATGIMSYLSSPLWLALIATGVLLTLQAHFVRPEYFSQDYQLYPTWPVFNAERMRVLFIFTMAVLFLPKIIGVAKLLSMPDRRRAAGGTARIIASTLFETLMSALYAPVMMLTQTRHVFEILTGRDSGWNTQRRNSGGDGWPVIWSRHKWHMIAGVLISWLIYEIEPTLLAWMSPTLAGLVLSGPLSWISGRPTAGRTIARLGLLRTGTETTKPVILANRDDIAAQWSELPEDGLEWLARDQDRIARHLAFNLRPPPTVPGSPDASRLTANAKLKDAKSLSEVLGWLTPAERIWVASDAVMLAKLHGLAAGR